MSWLISLLTWWLGPAAILFVLLVALSIYDNRRNLGAVRHNVIPLFGLALCWPPIALSLLRELLAWLVIFAKRPH